MELVLCEPERATTPALRAHRKEANLTLQTSHDDSLPAEEPKLSPQRRAALRKRWSQLIRLVYQTDPLVCPRCGGELRVVAFITEPKVIRKTLDHLDKRNRDSRAPPQGTA